MQNKVKNIIITIGFAAILAIVFVINIIAEDKKEGFDELVKKARREKSYYVSKKSYCNLEDDLEP